HVVSALPGAVVVRAEARRAVGLVRELRPADVGAVEQARGGDVGVVDAVEPRSKSSLIEPAVARIDPQVGSVRRERKLRSEIRRVGGGAVALRSEDLMEGGVAVER